MKLREIESKPYVKIQKPNEATYNLKPSLCNCYATDFDVSFLYFRWEMNEKRKKKLGDKTTHKCGNYRLF